MRRIFVSLIALLALAAASAPAFAEDTPVGFASLEMGPGARAQAMGSAYSSLADDPTAGFWNPAGLSRLEGLQLNGTHNQSFEGIRQEYFAASKHFSDATIGLSFGAVYNSDPLLGTDLAGDSTGTFGYYELVTTAGFGFRASKMLDLGVAAEMINAKIEEFTATGFGLNLGARYFPGPKNLSVGLSVRHLGPGITLDSKSSALPTTVQGGISVIRPAGTGDVTLSADLARTRGDSRLHALFGAEWNQRGFLTLQGGFRTGYDSEAFSFGVGVNMHKFQFQYAMVPYKSDLGSSSRFSVSYLAR
jgi:hypothetical protein